MFLKTHFFLVYFNTLPRLRFWQLYSCYRTLSLSFGFHGKSCADNNPPQAPRLCGWSFAYGANILGDLRRIRLPRLTFVQ